MKSFITLCESDIALSDFGDKSEKPEAKEIA